MLQLYAASVVLQLLQRVHRTPRMLPLRLGDTKNWASQLVWLPLLRFSR
jgi:hypothetical protein